MPPNEIRKVLRLKCFVETGKSRKMGLFSMAASARRARDPPEPPPLSGYIGQMRIADILFAISLLISVDLALGKPLGGDTSPALGRRGNPLAAGKFWWAANLLSRGVTLPADRRPLISVVLVVPMVGWGRAGGYRDKRVAPRLRTSRCVPT